MLQQRWSTRFADSSKNDPQILTGKSKPDYARCVDIATVASLKELWKSASIAIASPIIIGVILGPTAVAGLLMGAVVSGIFLAYHLANTGGAWDNAKKLIEMQGKKGSEEYSRYHSAHKKACYCSWT